MKSAKPRKVSDNQKVINKFIINDGKVDKYFYGREGALAKRLITKYGLDFLLWVPLPNGRQIQSLLWLSDQDGLSYLNSYLVEFKKDKTDLTVKAEQVELLDQKVGEDVVVKKKPVTLLDFLNKYK